MQNLNSYFLEMGLFDEQTLKDHCDRHLVRMHQSSKFPHLALLHYNEEAVYEKKWSNFCRACRGVVVDLKNKKLLAFPWEKFYNLSESPGPSYAECQKFGEFTASEKLDGSMIILFYDQETNQVHATTKGSFDSEQGVWATDWARQNLPAKLLAPKFLREYSLMFEMIQYSNKVVVDYTKKGYKEGLYLVGIRHNQSEKVFSYEEVQEFAREAKLLTLKTYSFPSLDAIVENAKTLPFQDEGYVLKFKCNGIMVKVKGSEYLRVHRFISKLEDRNLLDCMIAGQDKDVLDTCPEEYRDTVIATIENYRRQALEVQKQCYTLYSEAPKDDRKTLALWVKANVPSNLQKYIFTIADSKPLELTMIYQSFRKTNQASIGTTHIPDGSLILAVGISGSGKSTLLNKLLPGSVVSSDRCREILLWNGQVPNISSTEYWTKMQAVSGPAFEMFHTRIDTELSLGRICVADATNLRTSVRNKLEAIAAKHDAPVYYLVMCTDERLAIERDSSRTYPVGMMVISKQAKLMEQTIKDLQGKFNVIYVSPKNADQLSIQVVKSEMDTQPAVKKDTIVVDLDGTLAEISHRLHFISDKKHANWDKFFKECMNDTPNEWCLNLVLAMKRAGYNIVIVSARSKLVLNETRAWLDKIGLPGIELNMVREINEYTPDPILKLKWLNQFDKSRILFVLDDRDRVCKMWVEQGLQVLNCGQGRVF